jgi:hypothetical protein
VKEGIDRDFPELAAAGYQITSEATIIGTGYGEKNRFGIVASPADHPLTVIKGVNSATGRAIPALVSVSTTGPIPL